MPLTNRENFLRNSSLQGHEWIPSAVHISEASFRGDPEGLRRVCLAHPALFGSPRKDTPAGSPREEPSWRVDEWGCRWEMKIPGLQGVVVGSPLDDWGKFAAWRPPAPAVLDAKARSNLENARSRGQLTRCSLPHGFFFLRLSYLRGLENLLEDMAAGEPNLEGLIELLGDHYERIVRSYVEAGIDLLHGGDDLGMQTSSLTGPRLFRRYLLPTYRRLFQIARRAGAHVHLHSDGYLMDIAAELLETGLTILNPQDVLNGIDNLAREFKGRICIQLDIDRQKALPFGTPADVRERVKEGVLKLGSPAGGLLLLGGIYPPTPARNVEALCRAMEEFRTWWVGR